jgi:uncharacterized membrane protein (UPF0136 family)
MTDFFRQDYSDFPIVAKADGLRQNQRMSFPVLLLYIYGVVLIIGGIMGYVKAGSIPSLMAGCVCGVIALLLAYYYTWHFAPHAALLLSLLLLVIMGRRYGRTRKAMPALLVVLLSLLVAITQVVILITVG